MGVRTPAHSEADFPEPYKFGLWLNGSTFQVYRNLSLIKATLSSNATRNDLFRWDFKVYEHTGESWECIYEGTQGDIRSDHPLWTNGVAPKTLAVSDASVDAAIASILGTTND